MKKGKCIVVLKDSEILEDLSLSKIQGGSMSIPGSCACTFDNSNGHGGNCDCASGNSNYNSINGICTCESENSNSLLFLSFG